MKKVFTLALVMAIAVTGFAQVKGSFRNMKVEPKQQVTLTGFEERDYANVPTQPRNMMDSPELLELSQTYYDWQSNMGARNYVAVWPDGYAVACFTQSTDQGSTDRGTGLLIWDPAVGEWEYTEARVEGVKTGFGSIARYKENGLVIAAHTSNDCRIFIVEDFRQGNRDFGTGILLPTDGENGRTQDPCWPIVQCSGENLDIIHIMTTEYSLTDPYPSALLYTRYENGEFTVHNHIIPNIDENNISDGGSNIAYFMLYDPQKPNRVSFILNNAWSDGKLVISEDNGETWTDRVFYQHPNINGDFTDTWFFYPRWTGAAFDGNDNLHVAYEWNGTTGTAGSGSYYPALGGVAYWSEVLPKSDLCIGGIGEEGGPFIMDSTYMMQDLYYSEWYWSDAIHDPVPEYIGELQILDGEGVNVVPYDGELPEDYLWLNLENKGDHGSYNGGIAEMASMYYDVPTDRVFTFWSMICGDSETMYIDSDTGNHYLRIFANASKNGGRSWEGPTHVVTDFMTAYKEMVYGQVIPYLYSDADGEYLWYVFQCDDEPGTAVQSDESVWDNNFYNAIKVYVNDIVAVDEDVIAPAETTMQVYPNPAQGSFRVQLNNETDVTIFNAVGQLVKTYKNVKSLSVDLEPGIYFVKANNQTEKIVVF